MAELWRQSRSGAVGVSRIEHPSVLEAARAQRGECHPLAVNEVGELDMAALQQQLESGTDAIAVMAANNETGVVQPLQQLSELCRHSQCRWHCDAVQLVGKVPFSFSQSHCATLSLSAHKLNGPKGVGALVVREPARLSPHQRGGGQERSLRAGTENVAAIVGFGVAASIWHQQGEGLRQHLTQLGHYLEQQLRRRFPTARLFATEAEQRLPNTLFFALPAIEGQSLIMALDRVGFAIASGSACGSHHEAPSHVLQAMGVSDELARGAVRVSLGIDSCRDGVDSLLTALEQQVKGLRSIAALGW